MKTVLRGVCILPLLLCLLGIENASAQSPSRVEVGGQLSILRIGESNGANAGFGGRVTFDLSQWLAAEGEFNFFPQDTVTTRESTTPVSGLRFAYHRRRSEALFGIKAGWRTDRFGLFGKIRPGFTRLTDRGIECVGEICALILPAPGFLIARPEYRTEFALNVGGVVEFYPSARTVARLELGDTMIRNASTAPPCPGERCTTHNIASGFGFGFRF